MSLFKRNVLVIAMGIVWLCISAPALKQQAKGVDQKQYCSGDFEGCPPEGDGGDAIQNILKNRDIPPKEYFAISIEKLIGTKRDKALAMGRKHRASWSDGALQEVAVIECFGWITEAYLIDVKQQGPESCNCHNAVARDYHLWLGASTQATRAESLIAEVSSRGRRNHSGWRLKTLEQLAKNHAHLRMSGWGMWDGEHPNLIGQTRATLIEIHPIMKIEVENGDSWQEL